jgi:hypothetical protein
VRADIDADLLMTVIMSKPGGELCEEGVLASAGPQVFERRTGRPVVGFMVTCDLSQRLDSDLTIIAHEMFHALVRKLVVLPNVTPRLLTCACIHAEPY